MGPTISFPAVSTIGFITGSSRTTGKCTWTTRAPETASTPVIRIPCKLIMDRLRYWILDHGCRRFRLTWRRRWPVNCMTWTGFGVLRHRAKDPVISQVVDRRAVGHRRGRDIRWAIFRRRDGGNGNTVTPCGTTGEVNRQRWRAASWLTGSSDLAEATGRRPLASINFVTAHDGFTSPGSGVVQRKQ